MCIRDRHTAMHTHTFTLINMFMFLAIACLVIKFCVFTIQLPESKPDKTVVDDSEQEIYTNRRQVNILKNKVGLHIFCIIYLFLMKAFITTNNKKICYTEN